MSTQRNARGFNERTGDAWRNRDNVRRAKPNSKIKKLRIRLTITKMQVKNFDLEFLSLHPNWGHGTFELALDNGLSSRPVFHIIKLKENDKKSTKVSLIRSEITRHIGLSRQIVREYASSQEKPTPKTWMSGWSVPRSVTRYVTAFQRKRSRIRLITSKCIGKYCIYCKIKCYNWALYS